MRGKIPIKNHGGRRQKIKIRYLVVSVGLLMSGLVTRQVVQAVDCPDVRIVFARGSGGVRWVDDNYLAYKEPIEEKIKNLGLSYEFIDLDYPAIGIGDIGVITGAYFGAGEAYEFGESVKSGVKNLDKLVNGASCPNTKYVVGGYSQGAMVVSGALGSLNSERLIYAATFGDPKLYLPEGKGIMPAACRGENLSDYRMYVPDCQAYKGLLGAYIPYEPLNLTGKVGTWCNKRDIFCSSKHLDIRGINDHITYIADNLYEDASRVIVDKICKTFGIENQISSPHDTAILIDSTGSMSSMIDKYKAEALRLANETIESGGRIALYDYRDLDDPYNPVKHCDFGSCTLDVFREELEGIHTDGGGDRAESLLSTSFHVMKDLEWNYGSTKSLVVLTDADFLSPDRDGMSFDEVVALSKKIDPVNFYIVTNSKYGDYYEALASATDGKVVTNFDELSLLTDYIMERYDSLPRVEEDAAIEQPYLTITDVVQNGDSETTISFNTSGEYVFVIPNDAVLGIVETETADDASQLRFGSFVIGELDRAVENKVLLVPIGKGMRGEGAEMILNEPTMNTSKIEYIIPKAPNTGIAI